MTGNVMPFFPEFSDAKARNKWIKQHANYFTVVRRVFRSYERTEVPSFDEAIKTAKNLINRDESKRYLIYAVYDIHDALVATVTRDKVVVHEG